MKIRPILMSKIMTEALNEGRKTQTRRTRGMDEINKNPDEWEWKDKSRQEIVRFWDGEKEDDPNPSDVYFILTNKNTGEKIKLKSSYGLPGDILYVRETHRVVGWSDNFIDVVVEFKDNERIVCPHGFFMNEEKDEDYWVNICELLTEKGCPCDVNDGYTNIDKYMPWRPSIFMPKPAARFWLKILDIYPERLRDITQKDAIAEGIKRIPDPENPQVYIDYFYPCNDLRDDTYLDNPMTSFYSLWRSINGDESWQANLWVWRIEFEVVSNNGLPVEFEELI